MENHEQPRADEPLATELDASTASDFRKVADLGWARPEHAEPKRDLKAAQIVTMVASVFVIAAVGIGYFTLESYGESDALSSPENGAGATAAGNGITATTDEAGTPAQPAPGASQGAAPGAPPPSSNAGSPQGESGAENQGDAEAPPEPEAEGDATNESTGQPGPDLLPLPEISPVLRNGTDTPAGPGRGPAVPI